MKPHFIRLALGLALYPLLTTGSARAQIVISELMVHPRHVDGKEPISQEFIELRNLGPDTVNLEGWRFDRGIQFTFPSIGIPADGFVVIAADPSEQAFANIAPVVGPWTGRLSNRGERVRLLNAAGEIIDDVRYADQGDWASRRHVDLQGQASWEWIAPFDGEGFSLELIDPGLPNANGQNWKSSIPLGGTPGSLNSQEATETSPLIANVRHHPAVPTSRERVVIRAEIESRATDTITAELYYRVSRLEPGAFRSVPMTQEASGCFAGTVLPFPDKTVIEFYVEAEVGPASRTWPAPSDDAGRQLANALYQVDDEFETSDQPYYRIIMTAAEDARFRPEAFPAGSDAQMNATFITTRRGDTSIRYQSGLRRRGNGSRSRNPRSFKLTLPSDDRWRSLTSLNLVAQYTYLQTVGLHLFKVAQLPSPEAIFVQLRVNGINYANTGNRFNVHYGSYAHIQPLNGEFAEKAFPEDSQGDLYKKVSANPRRDRKRWGVHFEDQVVYNTPNWYVTDRWTKETNSSANDWSRFQDFIVTINEAPSETYVETVSEVIHIEQWVRWFALMNLLNNNETNLSNGIDDDYSIYQGVSDPRIVLLPHDLDTIFGLGDSNSNPQATIFQMLDPGFGNGDARVPQLEAFFNHPHIRPLYFQALDDLMETVLNPASFENLLDSLLSQVPIDTRNRIKAFNRARQQHVRSIIDAPLRVDPIDLPFDGDRYESSDPTIDLSGTVSPRLVHQVLINGEDVVYDRGLGQWSAPALPLKDGLNIIQIDAITDSAEIFSSETIAITTPDETGNTLSGQLAQNTVLGSSDGAFEVVDDLIVPAGVTLTLSEGTTLRIANNAQLITAGGTLRVEGTASNPVSLTGVANESWAGILLQGPATNHRLSYAIIQGVEPGSPAITLTETFLSADHIDLSSHEGLAISLDRASMELSNSELSLQSISNTGGPLLGFPTTLEANRFGVVQILERPADDTSVLTMSQNSFTGADTALQLEGRAKLLNNRFEACGTAIQLDGGELLIANQRFVDVNQVIRYTAASQVTLEHSVIHEVENLLSGTEAEIQGFIANNVITELNRAISNPIPEGSFIQFTHNFLDPAIAATLETANVRPGVVIPGTDPNYNPDFTLAAASLGVGTATHRENLGLVERDQPAILGAPLSETSSRSEFIGFYGSGWEQVEYRLDNGDWNTVPIPWLPPEPGTFREAFLVLQNLADGSHQLDYREHAEAPIGSLQWTVGQTMPSVVINEIAAFNTITEIDGGFPDWVELHNPGALPIVLSGYQLGGDGAGRLILPEDTEIRGGRYLVLTLQRTDETGFALDRDGETLTLYSPEGGIVDQLSFGRQLPNHTLGRAPANPNQWALGTPSPNNQNRPALVASTTEARFNEWYVASGVAYQEDFIELANAASVPIDISELTIRSNESYRLPAYSYLGVDDFFTLNAEDLGFGLNAWFGTASLLHPTTGNVIDQIFWQGEHSEASTGRVPNATGPAAALTEPSPGAANAESARDPLANLRISEIHFHPWAGQSEWLELLNIGTEALDLEGLEFSSGIDFSFTATTLAPQERILLVSDQMAFRAQYGDAPRIAGVFAGRLDNAGERFAVRRAGNSSPQLLVTGYEPDWYPLSNGLGFTLVPRNESRRMSDSRKDWQTGTVFGGTPGTSESPLIYSSTETYSILGDFLIYQIEALNGPTTFSATNLPSGITFDPTAGLISGTPEEFGTFLVDISATNASGSTSQVWSLQVASSGPFDHLQWEELPTAATQNAPFEATLSARDFAGRLVRDLPGEFALTATISRGGGPPVLINEIRDSGTDGLTVTKLDPSTDTTGWRILLNAAADRTINAVHGINAPGRILDLPANFTRLNLPENKLGFNLQWTDDSPSRRQGGQRGWALIINDIGEAIDFVIWGYTEEEFSRWVPRDETGTRIVGNLWNGAAVLHPGELGLTLARPKAVDTDSARDWEWLPRNSVPGISGPSQRETDFNIGLLDTERLLTDVWRLSMQSPDFGSEVRLTANETLSGFRATSSPLQILPSGPPELPEALSLQVVEGQPVALPSLSHPLTESLEIDEGGKLILEGQRILAQIDTPGERQLTIVGRNAVGESVTLIEFDVLADTDNDGLPDIWEATYSQSDPSADPDDDGVDNLTECIAGTDPTDSDSSLYLAGILNADREVKLSWRAPQTAPGIYTVESGQVIQGRLTWLPLHDGWIVSDGGVSNFTFTPSLGLIPEGRLLRVRVWENGVK